MSHLVLKFLRFGDHRLPLPDCATPGSAGYDLCAVEDTALPPNVTSLVPTGFGVEIPEGHCGVIRGRSSLELSGLSLRAGLIDADYRGELKVALHNEQSVPRILLAGDRIAQMLILGYYRAVPVEVACLSDTLRGTGGFGSTGRHCNQLQSF